MSTDAETLKLETTALETELEPVLGYYVELRGWIELFRMCHRLAEKRLDGLVAGVMSAAVNYLSEKGRT